MKSRILFYTLGILITWVLISSCYNGYEWSGTRVLEATHAFFFKQKGSHYVSRTNRKKMSPKIEICMEKWIQLKWDQYRCAPVYDMLSTWISIDEPGIKHVESWSWIGTEWQVQFNNSFFKTWQLPSVFSLTFSFSIWLFSAWLGKFKQNDFPLCFMLVLSKRDKTNILCSQGKS